VVHQVCQAHNSQADAAGFERSLFQFGYGGNISVLVHNIIEESCGSLGSLAEFFPVHSAIFTEHLRQVDRTKAAVFIGTKPLFPAGVRGFKLIKMRDGVIAISGIQEKRSRFAIVMRLADKEVKKLTCLDGFMNFDGNASALSSVDRAAERFVRWVMHVRKTQFPFSIILNRLHEFVSDTQGNVEIGNSHFTGLALNEGFHIGMIDPQDTHVCPTACASLGDLTECVVVDFQKANRTGRSTSRSVDDRTLRTKTREIETIAATRLLDQRCIAQGAENPIRCTSHVI